MGRMVDVVQVNCVVADLERSKDFYQRLGFEFVSRSRDPDAPAEAWVSDSGGVTLVLHSVQFATWWDAENPGPVSGGPQIDLGLESVQRLEAVVDDLRTIGVTVAKEPTDMSWGQRFAILVDPDGYRVGLKAPLP